MHLMTEFFCRTPSLTVKFSQSNLGRLSNLPSSQHVAIELKLYAEAWVVFQDVLVMSLVLYEAPEHVHSLQLSDTQELVVKRHQLLLDIFVESFYGPLEHVPSAAFSLFDGLLLQQILNELFAIGAGKMKTVRDLVLRQGQRSPLPSVFCEHVFPKRTLFLILLSVNDLIRYRLHFASQLSGQVRPHLFQELRMR